MAYAAAAIFLAIVVVIIAPLWLVARAICRPTLGDLENVRIDPPSVRNPSPPMIYFEEAGEIPERVWNNPSLLQPMARQWPTISTKPHLWPECP